MIFKGMLKTVLLLLLMLGLSMPVYGQGEGAPTVVMVFRHAEKAADQGRDPSLTEAGQQRAENGGRFGHLSQGGQRRKARGFERAIIPQPLLRDMVAADRRASGRAEDLVIRSERKTF